MTMEERLAQICGMQVITICNLQTQLEAAQAELAKLKAPDTPPEKKVTPLHEIKG
jgi:cell division protein FtsB